MAFASHRWVFATVIALSSSLYTHTWAQSAPPSDPAPAPTPVIEPAAPDAPPEKAKDTPKPATLTPIVPHPYDTTRPAFQLYAEIDLPILTVGLVFVSARVVRTQKAFCAPLCDPTELNALDRTTAGYWSPAWSTASNIGIVAFGAGVGVLLLADEGLLGTLNDAAVVAESAMSATAAVSIMTIAAGRPRPFLYGERAPLSERNSSDAGNSFLSSHAAVAFAIATSTAITVRRLHPTSRLQYAVLGLGLGAGSFVAMSRVLAGKHFITDAAGGALVGSSIGVLISSLHRSPITIVPVVGETQHGLGIQGSF